MTAPEPSPRPAGDVPFWKSTEFLHRDKQCRGCQGTGWVDSDKRSPYLTACPACRAEAAAMVGQP